jgi:endonuclease G
MATFVDTVPFDWSDRRARDLRDLLANTYYTLRSVLAFLTLTTVPPGAVNLDGSMLEVWHDIITKAANRGALRDLLQLVASSGDKAVALRIEEILGAEPVAPAPPPAEEPDWKNADVEAFERQIGDESTLIDVAFLRRGAELAPSVSRLLVTLPAGKYYGTAFRIGADLLLTNHHVLFDHDAGDAVATEVEIWFGYERDLSGRDLAYETVRGRPDTIVGDKLHDWAVVRVEGAIPNGVPIIDLAPGSVAADDRVYIIQHPNGGPKKIGMVHNVVRHVDDTVVQYWTDTEGGSSGSPVFDETWRLVALHHRWVKVDKEYRNQGQRIERVVEGLRAKGLV